LNQVENLLPTRSLLIIVLIIFYKISNAQEKILSVEHFCDVSTSNLEPVYNYNFADPVNADVIKIPGARSESCGGSKGDYFFSVYGPRYINGFDFHAGSDITPRVRYNGFDHCDDDASNLPDLICMCDGVIVEIDKVGLSNPTRGNGKTVKVKCNASFAGNPSWGNIYLAYRHMETVESSLNLGQTISKGSKLGVVEEYGAWGNHHLHFSVQKHDGSEFDNINPFRIFDPLAAPHLHEKFQIGDIEMRLLETGTNYAIFRAAFLHHQVALHSLNVIYNGSVHVSYVLEDVFDLAEEGGSSDLDDPCFVNNICVYPYPFNRYQTAFERYESKKASMSSEFPASPSRTPNYPIPDDYPYNTPAYVVDIKIENLPSGFDLDLLTLEIRDIYGNGIRNSGNIIQTANPGNWDVNGTWENGNVPGSNDAVLINHQVINNSGTKNVKYVQVSSGISKNAGLTISNGASLIVNDYFNLVGDNDGQNAFLRIVDDNSSLTVNGNFTIKRYNLANQVFLEINDNTTLSIGGNFKFISDNYSRINGASTGKTELLIGNLSGNPIINISGDFIFNHGTNSEMGINASVGIENSTNMPSITVNRDLKLISNAGETTSNDVLLTLFANSTLIVNGKVTMEYNPSSNINSHETYLQLNDNASLTVGEIFLDSRLSTGSTSENNLIQVLESNQFTINGDLDFSYANASGNSIENRFDFDGNSILEIKGNITNASEGSFKYQNNAKVIFSGAVAQFIPTTVTGFNYQFMELNNTSNIPLTLAGSIQIDQNLTLINGIIDGGANAITFPVSSTITYSASASSPSYIDGKVEKYYVSGGETFTYYIGDQTAFSASRIQTSNAAVIEAQYFLDTPPNNTNLSNGLEEIRNGYWNINRTDAGTEDFNLTLLWSDACFENINDVSTGALQTIFIGYHNVNIWEKVTSNIFSGSESCNDADGDLESGEISATINNSGIYALATTDKATNPLPVELLYFKAWRNETEVYLSWATASEINNEKFIVQRSIDAINFQSIIEVTGNGNSNAIIHYNTTDTHILPIVYYRLKQVNFDGTFSLSNVVLIKFENTRAVKIFPNPLKSGEFLSLLFIGFRQSNAYVTLLDSFGHILLTTGFSIKDNSFIYSMPLNKIKPGVYLLDVYLGHSIWYRKVLVR